MNKIAAADFINRWVFHISLHHQQPHKNFYPNKTQEGKKSKRSTAAVCIY